MESNARYYARRAVEERMKAQRAITEQARAWHAKLAHDFAERARLSRGLPRGRNQSLPRLRPDPLAYRPSLGGMRILLDGAAADGSVHARARACSCVLERIAPKLCRARRLSL